MTLWATIRQYLGLGRGATAEPIDTPAALGTFLEQRASFVEQTSLYGYLRTRAGMRYPELFTDKPFVASVSALCLFLMPTIVGSKNLFFLFLAVGIAYWQYGGGLALMPAFTGDFFGAKNLGFNYGLVFIGWGLGFFMARVAGTVKDMTGTYDLAFYLAGFVLIVGVIVSWINKRPIHAAE